MASLPLKALMRLVVLLALAGLVTAIGAGAASAHALLQASTPADGAHLDVAPEAVVLNFSENISATSRSVRVFDSDAQRVDAGDATSDVGGDPTQLRVSLPPLADGAYVVSWRATSADGHPVSGGFVFSVGTGAGNADDDLVARVLHGSSDSGLQAAAAGVRFLQYATAMLAGGGALFVLWAGAALDSDRARLLRPLAASATVAAIATVLMVGLQAALVTGSGLAAARDATVLGTVLRSGFGASVLLMLAGLALLAAGLGRFQRPGGRALAAAGAGAALCSFALGGHSASTPPRALVVSADIAHVVAGAVWFAGLALLWLALRGRRDSHGVASAELIGRFSSLAAAALGVVAVAGLALAWAEVRAPRAVLSTAYGRVLLLKLAIVGGVAVVAAYNNRRLVSAARQAGARAQQRLLLTIRVEALGIAAVLAVTAVLVNVVPARDAAGVTAAFNTRVALGEHHALDLTVEPNRAGPNDLHLYLLGPDGRPADVGALSVGWSLPARDIGPIEGEADRLAPGHWVLPGAEFPIAGRWTIAVSAAVSRFEQATAEIPVDLGA